MSPRGLREAKRRATIALIERAAVDAALELGHEQVTVEVICQAAEISRSTFFNHFPSRESAIFGRGLTVVSPEDAFGILDASAPDLFTGIYAIGIASAAEEGFDVEIARRRQELFALHPTAFRHIVQMIGEAQASITALVEAWLMQHPEHCRLPPGRHADEAALAVGAVTTAVLRLSSASQGAEASALVSGDAFASMLDDLRTVVEQRGAAYPEP